MIVMKQADIPKETQHFFEVYFQGEPMLIPRLGGDAVLVSKTDYEEMAKAKRNIEYLEKLDRSFAQLERGEVVVKTMEELRAMEHE